MSLLFRGRTAGEIGTPASGNLRVAFDADTNALVQKNSAGNLASIATDQSLATLHPADFTGGALLSDSNIRSAIQAAYDHAATLARSNPGGWVIQIPRKPDGSEWNMGSTGLDLYGAGYNANIFIQGPATLSWDNAFTGECIRLRGSTPATVAWGRGGLKDLIITTPNGAGLANAGIVLDACVLTSFQNVLVQGFGTGSGWKCRDWQGGNEKFSKLYVHQLRVCCKQCQL